MKADTHLHKRKVFLSAFLWFISGIIMLVVILYSGLGSLDDRKNWGEYSAEVIDTKIIWAGHMNDSYGLSVLLRIRSKENGSYEAEIFQSADKGALEKRVEKNFKIGSQIIVRVDPKNPQHVILKLKSSGFGIYIFAFVIGLFFFGNGMTTINMLGNSR